MFRICAPWGQAQKRSGQKLTLAVVVDELAEKVLDASRRAQHHVTQSGVPRSRLRRAVLHSLRMSTRTPRCFAVLAQSYFLLPLLTWSMNCWLFAKPDAKASFVLLAARKASVKAFFSLPSSSSGALPARGVAKSEGEITQDKNLGYTIWSRAGQGRSEREVFGDCSFER